MTTEQAAFLRDFFLPAIQREGKATTRVLKALPAGQEGYQPHAKGMSALDLAWHMAWSEAWVLGAVVNRAFTMGKGQRPATVTTFADVAAWYAQEVPPLVAKLAAADAAKLAEPLNFFNFMNEPAISYVQFLLFGHVLHHRGQLTTYLRAMGSPVPAVYGDSADEPLKM